MAMPIGDKQAAIAAVEKAIEALTKLRDSLAELRKAVAASPSRLASVSERLGETESELFDQRALVAHLRAETVRVEPMSQDARDALSGLLTRLNEFVAKDQAFHARLELAEQIAGLAGDLRDKVKVNPPIS